MVKKELINYVAEKANLSKKDAEAAVNAVFDGIVETLKADGKAARTGTNPATGAAIEIPASKAPVFKAGKALKETIK